MSQTNYKMYVVIDEYDNFANTLMTVDEASYIKLLHADGFVRLFNNVLKSATTDTGAIDRIFITGVSPLCLSDVTSGFNIAMNLSTEPRFNAMAGFTLAHLCNGYGYAVRTEAEMGHGYSDIYLYPINPDYRNAMVLELKYLKPSASDNEVEQTRLAARNQVAKYVADKRLQAEAQARGWEFVAAVAVFRGWKAEAIEAVV